MLKYKQRKWEVAIVLCLVLLLVLNISLISLIMKSRPSKTSEKAPKLSVRQETATYPSSKASITKASKSSTLTCRLSWVGDVLLHDTLLLAGNAELDQASNFDFLFQHLKERFQAVDFPIVNMEGTMSKALEPHDKFSAYPLFRSPTTLAKAMQKANVKLAVTSNNHCIDSGTSGVASTIKALRDAGIANVGTSESKNKKTWCIKEINGIKIGFSAWTYETVKQNGQIGINGILLPPALYGCVDSFSYESPYFANDLLRMQKRCQEMQAAGAEATVFFMHWGLEYNPQILLAAKEIAQALADVGCDLILATGPHCIQAIQSVQANNSAHQLLSYYSVGNFVSAQQYNTGIGEPNSANIPGIAEDGLLAIVEFSKKANEKRAKLSYATYQPLYCYKPKSANGGHLAQAICLVDAQKEPNKIHGQLDLITASAQRTANIMRDNHVEHFNFVDPYNEDKWLKQFKDN